MVGVSSGLTHGELWAAARALTRATDLSGIGVLVTDLGGSVPEVLFASPALGQIFGRDVSELTGADAISLIGPEEIGEKPSLQQEGTSGRRRARERVVSLQRADGRTLSIATHTTLSELDGRPVAVTFAIESVEAALRRSEETFRRVVESIPEPVWILGTSGLLYGNPAALRIFGFDRLEDALGLSPSAVTDPNDMPALEQRLAVMLSERRTLPPFEYRVRRRSGEQLTVEVSSIPLEYEGQAAVLTFARDVTLRKKHEAEALQNDRLAVLGLLAGGLAHAMNNPLSYVMLDLEEVARRLPGLGEGPEQNGELLARLGEARQGTQRIAEVVKRMRSVSRVDDEHRGAIDVRAVLDSVLELLGNEIRHRGELVTEYTDVMPVYASRGRIEQVFLSLLVNAVQGLPEDGSGRVRLSVGVENDAVVIEVRDDVPWQGERAMARALEPFPTPHTGVPRALSLPFCGSIVEGLGGTMSVDGVGMGTRVRVALPAAQPGAAPPRISLAPGSLRSSRRRRVLVIDEDPAAGSTLRLILEPEHSVTSITDARSALERVLAGDVFDVIFCDLGIPALGAVELFQELARRRPGLEQRIVFVTSDAHGVDALESLSAPDNHRVEKPFPPGAGARARGERRKGLSRALPVRARCRSARGPRRRARCAAGRERSGCEPRWARDSASSHAPDPPRRRAKDQRAPPRRTLRATSPARCRSVHRHKPAARPLSGQE